MGKNSLFEDINQKIISWTGFQPKLVTMALSVLLIPNIIGHLIAEDITTTSLRSFLSTSITAQATILTIVFSITIFNIQLTAPRYSPRLVKKIVLSNNFLSIFAVYVISIFWSSYFLLLVGETSKTPIFFAAGLFLATFIFLIDFIDNGFEKTSPEGILEAFESDFSLEEYRNYMKNGEDREVNSLYPLRSMFMSSLSENERATAEQTFMTYKRISKNLIYRYAVAIRIEDIEIDRNAFKDIFDQLREMAFKAESSNEGQMVSNIVEYQREMGEMESLFNESKIIREASSALSQNISKSRPAEGNRYVWSSSWRQLSELMIYSSEKNSLPAFEDTMLAIQNRTRANIEYSEIIPRDSKHVFRRVFESMKKSQSNFLDNHGERLKEVEFDWENNLSDDAEMTEYLRDFEAFLDALETISSITVRKYLETGNFYITEGNFMRYWRQICIDACNKAPENYAKYVVKMQTEIALVLIKEEEWSKRIVRQFAEIIKEGEKEVVKEVFNELSDYDEVNNYPEIRIMDDEDDAMYYQGLLGISDKPINGYDDFHSILDELFEKANQKAEDLQQLEEERQ